MEPTCYDGQVGLVNACVYHLRPPHRGDIIAFRPGKAGPIIVKRILALPGERMAFHTGAVFINGDKIEEPYLRGQDAWEWPEETMGKNVCFVAGDNRSISQHYRVNENEILGELIVLPR